MPAGAGRSGPSRTGRGGARVVLGRAADDDAVPLDGDLDGAVAGPVLCVDRVVLDRRVEPQAVALLAVIEGSLERARVAGSRARSEHPASSTPAPATGACTGRVVVLVSARVRFLRGLRLGLRPCPLG